MSQTMIKSFLTDKGYDFNDCPAEVNRFGNALATALGCHYDSTNRVLYMGDDDDIGFHLTYDNTNSKINVSFKLYANGTLSTNPAYILAQRTSGGSSPTAYLNIYPSKYHCNYIKTDNVLLFNFDYEDRRINDANRICGGFVKGKVLTDDDRTVWIPFYNLGTSLNSYDMFYTIEGETNVIQFKNNQTEVSNDIISMSPFIANNGEDVISSDYFFYVRICDVYDSNKAFELNGDEYLLISNYQTVITQGNFMRFAVKLT